MGLKKKLKKVGGSLKKTVKNPGKVIKKGGKTLKKVGKEIGNVIEDGVDIVDEAVDDTLHILNEVGEEFEEFVCDLVGKEPGEGCNVSAGVSVGSDTGVILTDGNGDVSVIPSQDSDYEIAVSDVWSWSYEQEVGQFVRSSEWIFQNPLDDIYVTSGFGPRTIDGVSKFHGAVDLRARTPKPVYSVGPGYVIHAGPVAGYPNAGTTVTVRYPHSIEVQYMHLSDVGVAAGSLVGGGATVGHTGDTGSAAGKPHLHMIVKVGGKRIDPMIMLGRKMKKGTTAIKTAD